MIFFDLDRTLFDYDHAVDCAMSAFYHQYRADLPIEESHFRARWVELYEKYWPAYELGTLTLKEQRLLRMQGLFEGQTHSTVELEKRARFHNDVYESNWRLFEDVLPCLDRLQGQKLGIISNGNTERQRKKMERTGILDRFDVVMISGSIGIAKPDARIFVEACIQGGATPEMATHIGDNVNADIEGAAAAGLRPIWVNRLGSAPGLVAITTTITTLEELRL
jgi:putative hydrolase of the HAD superfamily